jgi:hypothetical protein
MPSKISASATFNAAVMCFSIRLKTHLPQEIIEFGVCPGDFSLRVGAQIDKLVFEANDSYTNFVSRNT